MYQMQDRGSPLFKEGRLKGKKGKVNGIFLSYLDTTSETLSFL